MMGVPTAGIIRCCCDVCPPCPDEECCINSNTATKGVFDISGVFEDSPFSIQITPDDIAFSDADSVKYEKFFLGGAAAIAIEFVYLTFSGLTMRRVSPNQGCLSAFWDTCDSGMGLSGNYAHGPLYDIRDMEGTEGDTFSGDPSPCDGSNSFTIDRVRYSECP